MLPSHSYRKTGFEHLNMAALLCRVTYVGRICAVF